VRARGARYVQLPSAARETAFIPLFGQIDAIVNSLLIFRESRKCLHDNIADTIVVKDSSVE